MSPRKKKTAKKTPAKPAVEAPEAAMPDTLTLTGSTWVNPAPFQAVLEDIEALKTLTGQLTARIDELQEALPAQIGEAKSLAISGAEKLQERVFEALEALNAAEEHTNSIAKKSTDAHNLNVSRIDQAASRAAAMHRTVIDENERLAKRIAAIDIDLAKHRKFHEIFGAEAINDATVTQAEKIANLSKVVYVGIMISTALSAFALISAMH